MALKDANLDKFKTIEIEKPKPDTAILGYRPTNKRNYVKQSAGTVEIKDSSCALIYANHHSKSHNTLVQILNSEAHKKDAK